MARAFSQQLLFMAVCGGLYSCKASESPPPGHLLPLGSHSEPRPMERMSDTLISDQFHSYFVRSRTPVLLEGLLNSSGLLETWGDDQYLRERFGGDDVGVEHKKKENRSETGFTTTMADYLDRYEREDIYMVSPLSPAMEDEWLLPSFLLCGGFTDNLILSYSWFSSGGTKSVLHTDAFDNLHCLVSGVKEFVLMAPNYTDTIGPEYRTQGYYNIDVDQVDMLSYPGLATVPWYQAVVRAGDCLFLPHLWIHHVRSYGRNLGVNLWWSSFQYKPCSDVEVPAFAPLSKFGLVPELQLKQALLDHTDQDGIVHATDLHKTLAMRPELAGIQLEEVITGIFEILKPGCRGQLLATDVHSLPAEKFVSAFRSFMSSVEEEEAWWADEGGEWGEGGWEGGGGDWGYSELGEDVWQEEEGGGELPHDHNHDEL